MKDKNKPGMRTIYHVGYCLFMAVFFLTVPLQTTAREKLFFPGNDNLFSHYGDDNGLFTSCYWSGLEISSQTPEEKVKDKPRMGFSKVLGEIFVGALGNIGVGTACALVGRKLFERDNGGWYEGFGGAILGYFSGSTIGSALGVYIIGNSRNAKGSFGSALLGSLLGEGAAIVCASLMRNETVTIISFIVLPPIGAALLFNNSLRYKSPSLSHALFNVDRGDFKVGIPYVRIRPLPLYPGKTKPAVRFDVNLLNIVF